MRSKVSAFRAKTSSIILSRMRNLFLMLTVLLYSLILVGCPKPCQVCPAPLRTILPVEPTPTLRPISAQVIAGKYCLDDRSRRDLLVNFELLKLWGLTNSTVIEKFNEASLVDNVNE